MAGRTAGPAELKVKMTGIALNGLDVAYLEKWKPSDDANLSDATREALEYLRTVRAGGRWAGPPQPTREQRCGPGTKPFYKRRIAELERENERLRKIAGES